MSASGKAHKQLREMPDDLLLCRYENHIAPWTGGFYHFEYRGEWYMASEFLPCTKCGWTKIYLLDSHYQVVRRLYSHYAAGYLVEYDDGEYYLTKADSAQELASRRGVYADREEMFSKLGIKNGHRKP